MSANDDRIFVFIYNCHAETTYKKKSKTHDRSTIHGQALYKTRRQFVEGLTIRNNTLAPSI